MTAEASRRRALARLLVRLFPRAFREAHEAELVELHATLDRPLSEVFWDLVKNALIVRWEERRLRPGRASSSRRRPGGPEMESIWLDLRFAVRSLRKRPGTTLLILATLLLGIGSATTLFTVLDRVVLRPLPFEEPERLVRVWWRPESFNQRILQLFREESRSFESLAAYSGWSLALLGDGEAEELSGAQVTTNYFEVVGVEPALGRGFLHEESLPGRSDVVVMSHGLWMRRFGGDPGIIGRRIEITGAGRNGATVVGVLPRGHVSLQPEFRWQAWLPLERPEALESDDSWFLNVIGRLAPGVVPEAASAEAARLARLTKETLYPRTSEEEIAGARVERLDRVLVGTEMRTYLGILAVAVGVVLLLVCANVSSLLLTRHGEREREIALRSALGAGRGRVARQLVTESLLLAVAGGILGTAAAAGALAWIAPAVARLHTLAGDVSLDARVLAFALAISCVSAITFGALPALRASRPSLSRSLGGGLRSPSGPARTFQRLLVVFEVAASLVLVASAALMVTSLIRLMRVDPGFDADRVLIVGVSAPESRYPEPEATRRLYRELLPRLQALPGASAAGAIHLLPMSTGNWSFPYYPEGRAIAETDSPPDANFRVVSPGYFRAMSIGLLAGRDFDVTDTSDAPPVGLVNRAMAERLWPGEDPVGRTVRIFSPTGPEFTIVGVVADIRQHGLGAEPRPEMYRPLEQWTLGRMFVALRTDGDPEALAASARAAVRAVDPGVPVVHLGALRSFVGQSLAASRGVAALLVVFALLALVLALVGVYGVASAVVNNRVREIGIRMALGASSARVGRDTLLTEMIPIAAGVVLGLVAAVFVERILVASIAKLSAPAPGLLGLAAILIGAVGLTACWVPARRASRVPPTVALRFE